MALQSSRFISLFTSLPNRGIFTNIQTWVERMVWANKPIPKIGLYIAVLNDLKACVHQFTYASFPRKRESSLE